MKMHARSVLGIIATAAFVVMTFLFFTSCNKNNIVEFYSDGKWVIDRYYSAGQDQTQQYKDMYRDYLLDLVAGNHFIEVYTLDSVDYGIQGDWVVLNEGNTLRLTSDSNIVRDYIIVSSSLTDLKLKKGIEEWWLVRP